jgi:putative integral membrane protein (TIGR02587 family)
MAKAAEFDSGSYLRAIARAATGGLLFGMPLLYTMEVWWSGFVAPWWKILLLLGVSALFVTAFSFVEGFRRDETIGEAVWDTAIDFGLGIVVATVMLLLIGQLDGGSSLREWVGKIALEAVPVAIGASVARSLLGEHSLSREAREPGAFGHAMIAAGGALFFALNVAPTDEPMMIGIENDWWLILLLLVLMVPVTFGIVFYADFRGSHRARAVKAGDSPAQSAVGETLVSLAAALAVASMLLWFFNRIGPGVGATATLHQIVSLGFVAAIGAAAARLLL